MNKCVVLFFGLLVISDLSWASRPIVLSDSLKELPITRQCVGVWEDISARTTLADIRALEVRSTPFQPSQTDDLLNVRPNSAYWLRFVIENKSTKPFRVEMFDFDIDEISFFYQDSLGNFQENKAGYNLPFDQRELEHKNVSFHLAVPYGKTYVFYMRFRSKRYNVLEPMLRSYDQTINYSIAEYLLLGVFYGVLALMIFYNLLYFILLRKSHYCYYVLYAAAILFYLMGKNGTGFQYIWHDYPQINTYVDTIGLFAGVGTMLFFAISFLDLKERENTMMKLLLWSFAVRTCLFVVQLFFALSMYWEVIDVLYIQLVLIIGILQYKKGNKTAKWYVISYSLLDIAFVVTLLEQLDWIPSAILTVYALNLGIVLQFIFLSIGIGESVKATYRQKNEVQEKLIEQYIRNEKLKEQSTRELEEKVKDRTLELEIRNEEILRQREEIHAMNEHLEELVKKRTRQLEDKNNRIKDYAFSNSHLVRGPLARILGLTYLAESDKSNAPQKLFPLIDQSAKELDKVIKEMNKLLEEDES